MPYIFNGDRIAVSAKISIYVTSLYACPTSRPPLGVAVRNCAKVGGAAHFSNAHASRGTILLYRWILDTSTIAKLEQFQNEIGGRILQLPNHFSGKTVRLALQWFSMSTRVLIRKLKFLCRLLSDSNDGVLISREIFSSLATINVYGVSIIQQCRMLESSLGTNVLERCLNEPRKASYSS